MSEYSENRDMKFGTTAERTAYVHAKAGDLWYDTTLNAVYMWDGAVWDAVIGKVSIDQTTDGTTNKVQSHINVAGAAVTGTNPVPTNPKFKTHSRIIPLFDVGAWSGFTNQPANDGVEIVSDNAGDTGKCTIFGTTNGTGAFAYETVTLTGTNVKATTKTDWGNIYGILLGDFDGQNITPAIGTITIREASGDQTITTIAATKISKGMVVLNIAGKNVTYDVQSGNLWTRTAGVPTTANGRKLLAGYAVDEYVAAYLYLISDTSGATVCMDVWAD